MMFPRVGFLILIILLLQSCVKDRIEEPGDDASAQYFPLQLGKYVDYRIDSIVFDDAPGGNKKDTARFEIRELVADRFVNASGDTIYYIHRLRRNDSSQGWHLKDVWTAARSSVEAIRTEENLTFRKMIFPLRDGRRWIGTSYIHPSTVVKIGTENVQAYQEWEALIIEFDIDDTVGDFQFSNNVMHIVQVDTDDNATKRFVMEKYARGIGMIFRTDTILDSRCIELGDFGPCLGKPWLEHASKGYILSQVMIDHN